MSACQSMSFANPVMPPETAAPQLGPVQALFTTHEMDILVGVHNQMAMFSQLVARFGTREAMEAANHASACAFALQQFTHPCEPGVHMTKLGKDQIVALLLSVIEKAMPPDEIAGTLRDYGHRLAAAVEKAAQFVLDGTVAIPCSCATPQERLDAAVQAAKPKSSTIILPG